MAKFAVIIPAGGKGERFGGSEKKTFASLDGRPVFIRTLELFINRDDVCATILVVPPEDITQMKEKYGPNLGFMGVKLVEGGAYRCDSVAKGLEAVPEDADYIAVHDAVRPCATEDMVNDVFAEAQKSGAAILAAPLHGTIKRGSDAGIVEETVSRTNLYEAQTPQVFRAELLRRAYASLPEDRTQITDDAQLVELLGEAVAIVTCDASNLKITAKADLTLANAIIKSRPVRKVPKMGAFEEAQW
ncbi:MAG TPA: 2-C-methyl-D-erythritol 4-phosphate cytidylyltransferase [Phycisphaerae bacterium]|nr:2-C-methyl-D-erythritol 4-phosphate cytidylyltransferase [Phycisphaerales bacterium]HRX84969.1 2-C-methyl-D-erythritol 4-phosphate cytidylyltransferase [Phycisphaerae bacterium]